jgi:hypothetical protein
MKRVRFLIRMEIRAHGVQKKRLLSQELGPVYSVNRFGQLFRTVIPDGVKVQCVGFFG